MLIWSFVHIFLLIGSSLKKVLCLLGPYAWVQGRRATSEVTATSRGRLTNRYAWVPGRPACLGVNLPLRVPPCKHYPEEVTELKTAALILLRYRQRRLLQRNQIFRDRTNPTSGYSPNDKWTERRAQTFESEGRTTSSFHRPENSAESLPTMNISSSSVPQFFLHFCFCFFLFLRCFCFVNVWVFWVFVPPPPPPLFFFSPFLSLSLKESFFEYNWVSWPVLPSHLHSVSLSISLCA